MATRGRIGRRLLILIIAVVGNSATLFAQAAPMPMTSVVAAAAEPEPSAVRLLVSRSTVLDIGSAISRVALTSSDVADALVTSPSQLLINGKTPGTISMFVWERSGVIRRYEVIVQRDLTRLNEQIRQLFPGESIAAQSNGKDIVLSGSVSRKDVIEKAIDLASGYVDKREEVVSLLRLQEGGASNQVLLRVRFAEVGRNALTELGLSLINNGYKDFLARSTTQQYAAPDFDSKSAGGLIFSDYLNLFLFDMKNHLGALIKALQTRGLFQSLAEPNLVAESGKEASFLAGGEFPIPIAQPSSGGFTAVTVVFKEFGVRLHFTPTVSGDRVHLKVRPEVSTLDFNNAIVLQGFRIPALTVRRTETELELQDGQTFAIAGLLNNTVQQSLRKIPGIGDIPILGELFKSRAAQKERTELVVIITPIILPKGSHGVTPDLPRIAEPFLQPLPNKRSIEPPPPAFQGKQSTAARPAAGGSQAAAPVLSPAEAARAVSALRPPAPTMIEAPAAPAATEAPAGVPSRPLTADEKKMLEQARRQERQIAQTELRAQAAEARQVAKQAEEDRRKAEKERKHQEKLAREQAKQDAEAAKKANEAAKKQAKQDAEAAKKADEAAKKQAELAKKNQQ